MCSSPIVDATAFLQKMVSDARAFAAELTDTLLDDGSGTPSPATLALVAFDRVFASRPIVRGLRSAMIERVAARQRLESHANRCNCVASVEPDRLVRNARPPRDGTCARDACRPQCSSGQAARTLRSFAPKIARGR
jgi:hypothetical protein